MDGTVTGLSSHGDKVYITTKSHKKIHYQEIYSGWHYEENATRLTERTKLHFDTAAAYAVNDKTGKIDLLHFDGKGTRTHPQDLGFMTAIYSANSRIYASSYRETDRQQTTIWKLIQGVFTERSRVDGIVAKFTLVESYMFAIHYPSTESLEERELIKVEISKGIRRTMATATLVKKVKVNTFVDSIVGDRRGNIYVASKEKYVLVYNSSLRYQYLINSEAHVSKLAIAGSDLYLAGSCQDGSHNLSCIGIYPLDK